MTKDLIYKIRMDRFLELYDPFYHLFESAFERVPELEEFEEVEPVPPPFGKNPDHRFLSWEEELGRVRYFRELVLQGRQLYPISIDNLWSGPAMYQEPVGLELCDGHHRACGAALAGANYIRATYGGLVDARRYLQGVHNRRPFDG
jgi:hypothetical protein